MLIFSTFMQDPFRKPKPKPCTLTHAVHQAVKAHRLGTELSVQEIWGFSTQNNPEPFTLKPTLKPAKP